MGLDCYMFEKIKLTKKEKTERLIAGDSTEDLTVEIGYWRKNWELHEWMGDLYKEKGGTDNFNTTALVLNEDDIERLKQDLPDIFENLEFVEKLNDAFEDGNTVYYWGWF